MGLLNTLQTPYSILKERRDRGIRIDKTANEEMLRCLEMIGYSVGVFQYLYMFDFIRFYFCSVFKFCILPFPVDLLVFCFSLSI